MRFRFPLNAPIFPQAFCVCVCVFSVLHVTACATFLLVPRLCPSLGRVDRASHCVSAVFPEVSLALLMNFSSYNHASVGLSSRVCAGTSSPSPFTHTHTHVKLHRSLEHNNERRQIKHLFIFAFTHGPSWGLLYFSSEADVSLRFFFARSPSPPPKLFLFVSNVFELVQCGSTLSLFVTAKPFSLSLSASHTNSHTHTQTHTRPSFFYGYYFYCYSEWCFVFLRRFRGLTDLFFTISTTFFCLFLCCLLCV